MTVKQLIEKLKQAKNQEQDVLLCIHEGIETHVEPLDFVDVINTEKTPVILESAIFKNEWDDVSMATRAKDDLTLGEQVAFGLVEP